jgi:aspartyl-tRNA(Asn)/glutamyl-tRNA(Gln) amidotransferase subunit A
MIPAALCGVVGIKPTHGLVDAERVIPFARSLDTLGPLAGSIEAALAALGQLTGESYLLEAPPPPWESFRVAVPAGWVDGLDEGVQAAWERFGAGLPQVTLPPRSRFAEAILPILRGEAAAYHRARLARHGDLYQPDVRAFIEDGLQVTAAEYLESLEVARELREAVEQVLTDWDALLLPATAIVAPKVEAEGVREPLTRFTRPFNLTGHPAIAIPLPWARPLPVGIQVIGRLRGERALGRVALALEASLAARGSA